MTATTHDRPHHAPDQPLYALEARGLSKAFQISVLDDLSLGIRPGELVCLLGPNGCGKTTLLRILAGLESPDGGTVLVNDDDPFRRPERTPTRPPVRWRRLAEALHLTSPTCSRRVTLRRR